MITGSIIPAGHIIGLGTELRQPAARRSSRCSRAAGGSRPTASSRCARTTCSTSQFTTPGIEGAHEKGGVEGEVGRFRRNHLVPVPQVGSISRAQRAAARRAASRTWAGGSSGAPVTVGEALADGAAAAARAARRAVRRDRDRDAARRREVAGHGPPEPLLGPGRARRAEGVSARIGATRDHDQPRRPRGRAPRAAARQVRHQRAARSLPRAARSASPARWQRSLRAGPGTRPRRTGRDCFDELWAALTRPLRALGGRPADGRRADALPRARARDRSSSPSAARSPPARSTAAPSRSSPAAPSADRAAGAADGLDAAACGARAARARPGRLRPAARRRPMTATNATRRPRRWRR